MEKDRTYSIGTVARKVGVPKYKLRHWCDRYLPEIQKICGQGDAGKKVT